MEKEQLLQIMEVLHKCYPDAKTALNFENPFQLLVATMLSAQSTDQRVNAVTPQLFELYPTPWELALAKPEDLERYIFGCGLYRNKSKNLIEAAIRLVEEFGGHVPDSMEDLLSLAGVGRKTANVVISNAFDIPAIAVDTHVFRVANRVGLAQSSNVRETEEQLMSCIPRQIWAKAHHWLIYHGRRVCKARKPLCGECQLAHLCQAGKVE